VINININIQGCPHSSSFFDGAILIGPSPIFSEHWALLNRSASLDPQLQIRNKCAPLIAYLFSSYTGELNLGKPYGTKLRCFWELLGNLRNPMGTHWEQRGGKWKPRIQPSSPPKKKIGPLMSVCWAFSLAAWRNFDFQNCLSPLLAWANGRGMNCGT